MKMKSVKLLSVMGSVVGIGLLASAFSGSQSTNASMDSTTQKTDCQKPMILFPNTFELTMDQAKEFDPLNGVKGYDNYDGNITNKIKVEGPSVIQAPGTYTFTYTLKDLSGNVDKEVRNYTVIDDQPKQTVAEKHPAEPVAEVLEESDQVQPIETIESEESQVTAEPQETVTELETIPVPQEPSSSNVSTQESVTPATISFLGQTIPFIQCNGAPEAPSVGAGTWTGTGAVNDQLPTHFIGHNPGDFAGVMNITVGTPITVVDGNGNAKTYVVYEVLDVADDGINANDPSDDTWARVIEEGGERISLQTCITDTVNRIVLAR
ncbi:immunoglobulin-like domain-containing protein [Enterococcus crotali]|uniref:immunoglobulin-like domain-containing protein n=1 Tax=Enterococcus crotali TaxID=1453587 RepID=UPI000472A3DB|nr:immunoglobulin-like domain-containing protein [Enterococcus crotali]